MLKFYPSKKRLLISSTEQKLEWSFGDSETLVNGVQVDAGGSSCSVRKWGHVISFNVATESKHS